MGMGIFPLSPCSSSCLETYYGDHADLGLTEICLSLCWHALLHLEEFSMSYIYPKKHLYCIFDSFQYGRVWLFVRKTFVQWLNK